MCSKTIIKKKTREMINNSEEFFYLCREKKGMWFRKGHSAGIYRRGNALFLRLSDI
jgi:hypothetical protein